MPVFRLTDKLIFPPSSLAAEGGLLAVGGDLKPSRLLLAYRQGIFPWYSEGEPILWWSPDPRFVLFPEHLQITRSMQQMFRKGVFTFTFDARFPEVVEACRDKRRKKQGGTWITPAMMAAYMHLHRLGWAHSVEVWMDGALAGGLYGVSLGRCFFGESMFTRIPNASKAALIALTKILAGRGFQLIDCQVYTDHLAGLGAEMIPREEFLKLLHQALSHRSLRGSWRYLAKDGLWPIDENRHLNTIENHLLVSSSLTATRRRFAVPYFVHINCCHNGKKSLLKIKRLGGGVV